MEGRIEESLSMFGHRFLRHVERTRVLVHVLDAGAASRVIVCGGDTSSRITTLLGVRSLSIAANPVGNIVLLRAHADEPAVDGVELLLKGGQVGGVDLFDEVRRLGESEAGSR